MASRSHQRRVNEVEYRQRALEATRASSLRQAIATNGMKSLSEAAGVPLNWVRDRAADEGFRICPRKALPRTGNEVRHVLKGIGVRPDVEVARSSGFSVSTVRRARHRYGIPANGGRTGRTARTASPPSLLNLLRQVRCTRAGPPVILRSLLLRIRDDGAAD